MGCEPPVAFQYSMIVRIARSISTCFKTSRGKIRPVGMISPEGIHYSSLAGAAAFPEARSAINCLKPAPTNIATAVDRHVRAIE